MCADVRFLLLLLMGVLITGCGAERDPPESDSDNETENEDLGQDIFIRRFISGSQPLFDVDGDRQLLVFKDEETYFTFLDRYTDQPGSYEPDFEQGQVLLIDQGQQYINNCDNKITLNTVYAAELGENLASVEISYNENNQDSSFNCSDVETQRLYYFYFVETRKPIVISEQLL